MTTGTRESLATIVAVDSPLGSVLCPGTRPGIYR